MENIGATIVFMIINNKRIKMKKIILCLIIVLLAVLLTGCGAKKCFTCGKTLEDGGFTAFANDYCGHCFMYDLGLDK